MHERVWIMRMVVVAVLWAWSACGPALAAGKSGAVLYRQNCARCHGDRGAGDGPFAWLFATPPRNLRTGVLDKYTTKALVGRIREGTPLPLMYDAEAIGQRADQVGALVAHLRRMPDVRWAEVEKGAELWVDRCETCHGPYGKPAERAGKPISPQSDLSTGKFAAALDDDALRGLIQHARKGLPKLSPALSATEARVLLPYVKLFSPGFELYGRYCSTCHGEDGWPGDEVVEGMRRPTVIFDRDYMAAHDDDYLSVRAWHMVGEQRQRMPHFARVLDEPELRSIIDYLRSTTRARK